MTSSEIAFAIFIAMHNLPMAVGDEVGLLAKKMWCSTVPVAHPRGEKNTNYRFSRFFVRAVPLFRSLMLTPMVPTWIIKVLVQWYCNQSMCVRWGSVFSDFFLVNNGVRQGGILSPLLFNIYINELSESLSKLPIGCCCGNTVVNHLMYADDIVLFAPSAKGLQKTVNVCYAYGCDNDIYTIICLTCDLSLSVWRRSHNAVSNYGSIASGDVSN